MVLEQLRLGSGEFCDLFPLFHDPNPLIQMRALDIAERFLRENPASLDAARRSFLIEIDEEMLWEGRLSLARILGFANWKDSEREEVMKCLRPLLDDPQPFVSAWALDTLSILSQIWPELREEVEARVCNFLESGTASQRARCRQIIKRLGFLAPPLG